MAEIRGLKGLRPHESYIGRITCPPYDVIKPGTQLEHMLQAEPTSLVHITLGQEPLDALKTMMNNGVLVVDDQSSLYVYEQQYAGTTRIGVLAATKVYPYEAGDIIRHEKTFDEKVKGRLELRRKTGYTFEPVFFLTKAPLQELLETVTEKYQPLYAFESNFAGESELDGIKNRIFKVPEESPEGLKLMECISKQALYIADGHHRYHASLRNGQTHCLGYICDVNAAKIQAYNRVINGVKKFADIRNALKLTQTADFITPPKHCFALYTREGSFLLEAQKVPKDIIQGLDCSILERELYPLLGLSSDMIKDERHFDYYAESQLDKMRQVVDAGTYDLAVALHPVSSQELLVVAEAGITNTAMVMPEKSTFFAPKILSGVFIYQHCLA